MLNGLLHVSSVSSLARSDIWVAFLFENALKGSLLLIAAFAANLLLRRASSATRHLVWILAFGGLLALPLLSLALPAWHVPLRLGISRPTTAPRVLTAKPKAAFERAQNGSDVNLSKPAASSETAASSGYWSSWLLLVWAAGFAMVGARLAAGMAWTGWTARRAGAFRHPEANALLNELSARLGLPRRVRLLESSRAIMPMTWGGVRPVILLPHSASTWPVDRLRVVVAHELAHVKRHDCLTQVLAQFASSLYWFNPLVWLAAVCLRRESERACDDRVLALETPPGDYAQQLVELARALGSAGRGWFAAVAMAHSSHLEDRVVALLDPQVNRHALTRRIAILAAALFMALLLPVSSVRGLATAGSGKIWGIICDPSGARIPGAAAALTNVETHSHEVVTTDEEGKFQFPGMPAGRYTLEVEKPGFARFFQNLSFKANGDQLINIMLQIGSMAQIIEVVAKGRGPSQVQRLRPTRIRVGGLVEASKLIAKVDPVYPEDAQKGGIEGAVLLDAVILKDGTLGSVKVVDGANSELAQAAVDAVKQWRYSPTLLNGEPVEVVTTITVEFKLEQDTKETRAK